MNDLILNLYQFASNRLVSGLWLDPEYRDFARAAELQEARLRARLDDEGTQCLNHLLDELGGLHAAEQEAVFQSALALFRELNALLH